MLRMLELCAGYGGFSLGLQLTGLECRTVCYVERDAYAASILVERIRQSRLDDAPIWDDIATFNGLAWNGCVDLVCAGFPCQPFSTAGQRRGVDDDRWLWPSIGRIIRDVGPRLVFLENVPGLVRAGLPHVLSDLADLGFDAEWGLLSASDVGAPHRRQRFWLLAALADNDSSGRESLGRESARDRFAWDDVDGSSATHVADTDDFGSPRVGDEVRRPLKRTEAGRPSKDVAVATSARRDERQRQTVKPPQVRRRRPTGDIFPPRPDDRPGWERWTTEGGPEPQIRRSTNGRPVGLADALHLGGNGLVPRVAAEAFAQLATRLGIARMEQR